MPADDAARSAYEAAAQRKITAWVRGLDATSSDGARIASLLTRLAPHASVEERRHLKTQIICDQIRPTAFPRHPRRLLIETLRRYTYLYDRANEVGYDHTTAVDAYLDLTRVPPDSDDERTLASFLARHMVDLVGQKSIRPTTVAISKLAATGVLRKAVEQLPFPLVLVSPYGPNRNSPIEGYYEIGDEIVLLHDVALSGQHLVDCIARLRGCGLRANNIVTLVQYQKDSVNLGALMSENNISLHAATTLTVENKDHQSWDVTEQPRAVGCLLCDVLREADTAPFRTIFSREEIPSEILCRTRNFVTVGDVAPLAKGHLMLVSKKHAPSMSHLPPHELEELDSVRRLISNLLKERYSNGVIAFEHGLCDRDRQSDCGIDHAHLHVLPFAESINARSNDGLPPEPSDPWLSWADWPPQEASTCF